MGGFCAGVIANPVDIVYNRQVADALYPQGLQRNYTSFLNGLTRVHLEGALFRGAVASGIAIGMLHSTMSNVYDFLKEYYYWFVGPSAFLRPFCLAHCTLLGLMFYLPFDNLKVRFHTMTPLPNGEMPYKSLSDAMAIILEKEGNRKYLSSVLALYNGGVPALMRMFLSLYGVFYFLF